jgi:hypothetical protein
MHRAIEPRNIVWRIVNDTPVVKLLSLGHAKLARAIEKDEHAFIVSAHYSGGVDAAGWSLAPSPLQRVPSGGAMGTKLSPDQQGSRYLAPEYRRDPPAEFDYAMDWFSGSPTISFLSKNSNRFATADPFCSLPTVGEVLRTLDSKDPSVVAVVEKLT